MWENNKLEVGSIVAMYEPVPHSEVYFARVESIRFVEATYVFLDDEEKKLGHDELIRQCKKWCIDMIKSIAQLELDDALYLKELTDPL